MSKTLVLALAVALLVPYSAHAESPFNGTWSLIPASIHLSDNQVMTIVLRDGVFKGDQDGPTIKVPANGKDYPVPAADGFTTVAIHVINDHTFKEVDKEKDKVVVTALVSATPDAKTLTVVLRKADGSDSTQLYRRLAPGPRGANGVSGKWQADRLLAASGGEFNITYKIRGNQITSLNPEGSFVATLGGKPVPYRHSGMRGITVAAAMPAANVLRETFYKDGKEVSFSTFTIQPDGRTMKNVDGGGGGAPSTVSYRKQ